MTTFQLALFKSIIKNAQQYEDGTLGLTQCVERYCEEHDVALNLGYEAVDWYMAQEALSHGIPASVVQGKAKLRDYFSEEYINWKCNIDSKSKF